MYKNRINYKLLNFLILMGLLYIIVTNIGTWFNIFLSIISICMPFIIAFAIAYALNPIVRKLVEKGYKVKDVYKARPVYLDIPILAAYKFAVTDNAKLFINAGPYLAFGLGGKVKFDGGGDMKVFDKDEGDADRFDIGLQWGIGAELNDHYIVSITGQHGFISPFDEGKNMSFAIGVGYRF